MYSYKLFVKLYFKLEFMYCDLYERLKLYFWSQF